MQDLILGIIAVCLVVLTIEITIVLYFMMIFLNEAIALIRKVKALEGSFEVKLEKLEMGLALLSAGIMKKFIKGINKFLKK